jgi:hypothetical protein
MFVHYNIYKPAIIMKTYVPTIKVLLIMMMVSINY